LRIQRQTLLEVFGKYRSDHEEKVMEAEVLAKVLEPFSETLTVGSYDTTENYLPAGEFAREEFASHAEWYWVPAGGGDIKKLSKPKKDPSMKKVVQFLKAQASGMDINVEEVMSAMNAEKENRLKAELASEDGSSDDKVATEDPAKEEL